jgi:hypothetical protein
MEFEEFILHGKKKSRWKDLLQKSVNLRNMAKVAEARREGIWNKQPCLVTIKVIMSTQDWRRSLLSRLEGESPL